MGTRHLYWILTGPSFAVQAVWVCTVGCGQRTKRHDTGNICSAADSCVRCSSPNPLIMTTVNLLFGKQSQEDEKARTWVIYWHSSMYTTDNWRFVCFCCGWVQLILNNSFHLSLKCFIKFETLMFDKQRKFLSKEQFCAKCNSSFSWQWRKKFCFG